MTKEFDVDLNVSRSNHVITARGKKENVLVAKKRLNQFLHGGDGRGCGGTAQFSPFANHAFLGEEEQKRDGYSLVCSILKVREIKYLHCTGIYRFRFVSTMRIVSVHSLTHERQAHTTRPKNPSLEGSHRCALIMARRILRRLRLVRCDPKLSETLLQLGQMVKLFLSSNALLHH